MSRIKGDYRFFVLLLNFLGSTRVDTWESGDKMFPVIWHYATSEWLLHLQKNSYKDSLNQPLLDFLKSYSDGKVNRESLWGHIWIRTGAAYQFVGVWN